VTIVKTQLRKMESENELDKKRIVERFETELNSVTEYFKRQVQDVRSDFEEEIRQMQKMRARDKSDADNSFKDLDKQLTVLQEDLIKY
jgi:L-amino acid N-acyltransferase YncA